MSDKNWKHTVLSHRCDKVATNTQRESDVNSTTSKLQRCSNDASTFDSKFNLGYTMNVVLAKLLKR